MVMRTTLLFILKLYLNYEGRSKSNASYLLTQKVDEIGRREWHHSNERTFFVLRLFFYVVTTTFNALLPAMNESLDASLVKVSARRGGPFLHGGDDGVVVWEALPT